MRGQLVYLKQLNYTTGQSKYLAVSTDLQDNLYVVWYQPSIPTQSIQSTTQPATDVAYLRMNLDGDIEQTGNAAFSAPIIGVTVLSDGSLYGVSPNGLVKVTTPTYQYNPILLLAALAFVGGVGFAGSTWISGKSLQMALTLFRRYDTPLQQPTCSR